MDTNGNAKRVGGTSHENVSKEPQHDPEQTPVEPATEIEDVIEEEQGEQAESETQTNEPQGCEEQGLIQPDNPQQDVEEPELETQPPLRRSTRERRPGQIFSYTFLGQPTYQSHSMVSASPHCTLTSAHCPTPTYFPLHISFLPHSTYHSLVHCY